MKNKKEVKICKVCKKEKILDEFYCRDNYYYTRTCKECYRENQKKYPRKIYPKNYYRKHMLKSVYNLTEEEYNNLYREQNGKCAICSTPESELKRRLSIDHCHKTGKVRGLLCTLCNQGLGHFRDNTSNLENALFYLILHK